MEIKEESIVAEPAICIQGLASKVTPMTKEQCDAEANYRLTMNIMRKLYQNGLISSAEYRKIDTIVAKKYGSYSCSLLS